MQPGTSVWHPADQVEQELAAGLGERQIAELVEHEEVQVAESVGHASLPAGAGLGNGPTFASPRSARLLAFIPLRGFVRVMAVQIYRAGYDTKSRAARFGDETRHLWVAADKTEPGR